MIQAGIADQIRTLVEMQVEDSIAYLNGGHSSVDLSHWNSLTMFGRPLHATERDHEELDGHISTHPECTFHGLVLFIKRVAYTSPHLDTR